MDHFKHVNDRIVAMDPIKSFGRKGKQGFDGRIAGHSGLGSIL